MNQSAIPRPIIFSRQTMQRDHNRLSANPGQFYRLYGSADTCRQYCRRCKDGTSPRVVPGPSKRSEQSNPWTRNSFVRMPWRGAQNGFPVLPWINPTSPFTCVSGAALNTQCDARSPPKNVHKKCDSGCDTPQVYATKCMDKSQVYHFCITQALYGGSP
jgi:hypothetical protein